MKQDCSMSDDPIKNRPRAMKGNHQSSGKGDDMDRTVYTGDNDIDASFSVRKIVRLVVPSALVALVLVIGVMVFVNTR
jgi:hypothetical protein